MALGQAKYFSTLDLVSDYWQVTVRDQDCEKTAFITTLGLFEFNHIVMPPVRFSTVFRDVWKVSALRVC